LATDSACVARFKKVVNSNPAIVKRIVNQHDITFLISIIEAVTAVKQDMLPAAVLELAELIGGTTNGKTTVVRKNKEEIISKIWQHIIIEVVHKHNIGSLQLAGNILLNFFAAYKISYPGTIPGIHALRFDLLYPVIERISNDFPGMNIDPGSQQGKESLERRIATEPGPGKDIPPKNTSSQPVVTGNNIVSQKESGDRNGEPIKKEEAEKIATGDMEKGFFSESTPPAVVAEKEVIDEDGIYIVHAGLVLVHPFLPHFFKHTNLLDGNHFSDAAAQQKAIYLLHYLATGSTTAAEHELVMPKLLCDYPIEEPVEVNIPITKEDRELAEDMLAAVIKQWGSIGQTSPDGLRESFLFRNGKVFTRNNNKYIHVEQRSYDMLLDKLPWGLGIIRLPWRKELLRVEWR